MQQPNTSAFRWLPIIWLALAAVTVLAVYIALVWAIPRGFDWTDEAWSYSLIASNRVSVGEVWGFQHVLHPFFVATGRSIIIFRSIRLLGYLLVSAFLLLIARRASVILKWRLGLAQWLLVFAGSQIGTFLAWSYPPRTLGYNELAAWLTEIGVGLLLLIVVARIAGGRVLSSRLLWLIWAGLGAIALLLVMVKVTSGLAFFVLGVVALFVRSEFGAIKRVLASFAGVVVGAGVLLVSGFPFVQYVQDLLSLVFNPSAQSANAHPVGGLLRTYAHSLFVSLGTLGPRVLLVIVFIALLFWLDRRPTGTARERPLAAVAIVIACLAFVSLTLLRSGDSIFDVLGERAIVLVAAAVMVLAVLVSASTGSPHLASRGQRWALALGVLILLAGPFVSAVGTNNSIVGELLYASTIWAIAGAFALVMLGKWLRDSGRAAWIVAIPSFFVVLLVVVGAVGVAEDITGDPYRIAPYASQNTPTDARDFQGILLTPPAAAWANWMSTESSRLSAADVPTVGISSPGGVLTFNNSPFANPWVQTGAPISLISIQTACTARDTPPKRMFVLQPTAVPLDSSLVRATQKALRACNVDFPADFVKAAQYTSTDPAYSMTIWSLK